MTDELSGELLPGSASRLVRLIREALGVTNDEPVQVYAPPHRSRMDGREVVYAPVTRVEFEALRALPRDQLMRLGLRAWDESGLLLFPVEWYSLIPDGFEVLTISGKREQFVAGVTDDDCRYGVLAYGIVPSEVQGQRPSPFVPVADPNKEN